MADETTPRSSDYASIDRASDELTLRGWHRFSMNEALDAWESFVEVVEAGYSMSVYEYTNDLKIRGWADEARQFLTPLVIISMDERLGDVDARFWAATEEVKRLLPGAPGGWWGRRLPRVLVGELAGDARRLGLL